MGKSLHYFAFTFLPNIGLVIALVLLIRSGLAPLAFALLVLSKWQILLGGHKIWLRSIRDNACDLVVALSTIIGLILFGNDPTIQVVIAVFYALWLVVLKPQKGTAWVALQAGVCQLVGLSVVYLLGRSFVGSEIAVVFAAWLVAMISADHLLNPHKDPSSGLITAVWGLIVAELSWILWRWLVLYSLFDARVLVPQAALVITVLGYGFGAMYLDHAAKRLRKRRLAEYLLISFALLAIIVIGTNWNARI